MKITAKEIIDYWFSDRIKKYWFASTPALDTEILEKYAELWERASAGELDDWEDSPDGCLALVIVLDQFPLNMFRSEARSFCTEEKAIQVAHNAISREFDREIPQDKRAFLYMPFMHSEVLADQDLSVKLYTSNHLEANTEFAEHHREIIRRFGRFPHRNQILGRESTEDELNYLASEDAFKG